MIAKTRRNFVLITMVLLTAVIVAFVGSTVFINYRSSSNETEFALRELLRSQGGSGGNIKGGRRYLRVTSLTTTKCTSGLKRAMPICSLRKSPQRNLSQKLSITA